MITHTFPEKYHIGEWKTHYEYIFRALKELGYRNRVSFVRGKDDKEWFDRLIAEEVITTLPVNAKLYTSADINIFNHTTQTQIQKKFRPNHKRNMIVKATGPTNKHFSIDLLGYAGYSSISYKKQCLDHINPEPFFSTQIADIISNRENKWGNTKKSLNGFSRALEIPDVPDNHILIIQQSPTDEVVTRFSFGDYMTKFDSILSTILEYTKEDIVIKGHPIYKLHNNVIQKIEANPRITFLKDPCSLHDILPKTKVAIMENSTSGLECIMHDVPVISYGYPEYHSVTYDLRHLLHLPVALQTIDIWWDRENSRKWLTWYVTEYLCYDYESTKRRILQLLDEIKNIS